MKGLTAVFLFMLSVSFPLAAHEIKETTCRVTFRDGQVELELYTNISRWESILSNSERWMLGDTDVLMPSDLDPLGRAVFVQKLLLEKLKLTVKNTLVHWEVSQFPLQLDGTGDGSSLHGEPIILQSKLNSMELGEVSIAFPKSLGPVHVSFVRPIYRLLAPGQPVTVMMNE